MPIWLAVAVGGALGSVARWKAAQCVAAFWPNFPWGVLIINVSGSFLIGLTWAYADARPVPEWVRLGLMTGVLGGFTTFSAFSLDTMLLWKSTPAAAALNIVGSVGLSLAACAAGIWLARQAVTV